MNVHHSWLKVMNLHLGDEFANVVYELAWTDEIAEPET